MESKVQRQWINLVDLQLDTQNYRFERVNSQREAIVRMIDDQGDKLANLAEDICLRGLNPSDTIIVCQHSESIDGYIVLEGNRRITALKLLNTPSIIGDENDSLRRKFVKLNEKYSREIPKRVECVIVPDRKTADLWIYRKHGGQQDGIGTVTWNAQQIQRYKAKSTGKTSPVMKIISLLDQHVDEAYKKKIRELNITNFDRLISDPYVRQILGLNIRRGKMYTFLSIDNLVANFRTLIDALLRPDFKVKKIYHKSDRKEYIDSISDHLKHPDLSHDVERLIAGDSDKNQNTPSADGRPTPKATVPKDPRNRTTLIPKDYIIDISNIKLACIFRELQQLSVKKFTYSCSVMLRVLIEGTLDCFINAFMSNSIDGVCSEFSHLDLNGKVNRVKQKLQSMKLIDEKMAKGIKSELQDKKSPLSVETLHAYVHNTEFNPKPENLLIGWDNIQFFFDIVWKTIKNNSK